MRLAVERLVVGVLIVGFVIGTSTHMLQIVNRGWVVFAAAPIWMNVYWTSLTFLDPFAAFLLLRARRAGLMLAVTIMLSDVAVNTYALYGLSLPFAVWALQLQTVFCGVLLGAAGFLWRGDDEPARPSTRRASGFGEPLGNRVASESRRSTRNEHQVTWHPNLPPSLEVVRALASFPWRDGNVSYQLIL
jgi:hypothetical protein